MKSDKELEKKIKKLQTTQPDVIINFSDLHWAERDAIIIRELKAQLLGRKEGREQSEVELGDKNAHIIFLEDNKLELEKQLAEKDKIINELEGDMEAVQEGKGAFLKIIEDKGYKQATSDILKKIDEMLEYNIKFTEKNVLPKGVKIPFINGEELKQKIQGVKGE